MHMKLCERDSRAATLTRQYRESGAFLLHSLHFTCPTPARRPRIGSRHAAMPSNLPVVPPVTPIAQLADSTSSSTDQRPKRKIYTAVDLDAWFSSRAHADLEAYALELCHAVEGRKVEDECFESEVRPFVCYDGP